MRLAYGTKVDQLCVEGIKRAKHGHVIIGCYYDELLVKKKGWGKWLESFATEKEIRKTWKHGEAAGDEANSFGTFREEAQKTRGEKKEK